MLTSGVVDPTVNSKLTVGAVCPSAVAVMLSICKPGNKPASGYTKVVLGLLGPNREENTAVTVA